MSQQVRLVDIVPTILDLADLSETTDSLPAPSLDGVSLAPLMAGAAGDVPPEAWSYAAFSNFGLGLRIRNTRKYTYNNAVWSPIRDTEELFEISPDGERPIPSAEPAELERVRREARRVLSEEAAGVRVRFENLTDKTVEALVRGQLIHQGSLKSVDLPCDCVRWKRAREITVEVPPGVSYTLIIENLSGNWIDLELEGFGTTLLLDELRETRSVVLTDQGWKLRRPTGESGAPEALTEGATVSFWLVGDFASEAAPDESEDPALQDRLRALGYIN